MERGSFSPSLDTYLVDTNVFIDHLRGRLDLRPLFKRGHSYSLVSAKELLGLTRTGKHRETAFRKAGGLHRPGISDAEIGGYLEHVGSLPYNLSLRHWFGSSVHSGWARANRRTLRLLLQFHCVFVSRKIRARAKQLLIEAGADSRDFYDALIASTAIEHGMVVLSADAGFRRFPVRLVDPYASEVLLPRSAAR